MDVFDFPLHKREFKYLNNSNGIQLGRGYSFMSKPNSPMLKEFEIVLTGFRYYFTETGEIDYETNANKDNVGALCKFYEKQGTYETFIYPDEQFGRVHVRFKDALEIPQTNGRRAVVGDIKINLSEVTD